MTKKRNLVLGLGLVMVTAAVSIGGTIAWLTDSTQEVENTFTVGNIDITLKETGTTLVDGVDTKSFKMVPGNVLEKDPTVTVEGGSEECWLFVEVTESENLDSFITYAIANDWTELDAVGEDGDVYAVVYRKVAADEDDQVFAVLSGENGGTVTVKDGVTKAMMNDIEEDKATEPTLTFKAYAIQAANFETVEEAWDEVK